MELFKLAAKIHEINSSKINRNKFWAIQTFLKNKKKKNQQTSQVHYFRYFWGQFSKTLYKCEGTDSVWSNEFSRWHSYICVILSVYLRNRVYWMSSSEWVECSRCISCSKTVWNCRKIIRKLFRTTFSAKLWLKIRRNSWILQGNQQ